MGFATPLHTLASLKDLTPPVFFSEAFPNTQGVSPGIKSFATGAGGLVVGAAGAAMLTGLGKKDPGGNDKEAGKKGERGQDKEG